MVAPAWPLDTELHNAWFYSASSSVPPLSLHTASPPRRSEGTHGIKAGLGFGQQFCAKRRKAVGMRMKEHGRAFLDPPLLGGGPVWVCCRDSTSCSSAREPQLQMQRRAPSLKSPAAGHRTHLAASEGPGRASVSALCAHALLFGSGRPGDVSRPQPSCPQQDGTMNKF